MKKNLALAIAGKKVKGSDSAQELTTERVQLSHRFNKVATCGGRSAQGCCVAN